MTRTLRPLVWCCGCSLLLASFLPSCTRDKVPLTSVPYVQYVIASWYGAAFHGRPTASGEVYNMFEFTAAHGSAPLGMQAIVTNLDTGQWVRVRINDRGPMVAGRILDLSYAAARHVGMVNAGLARVRVEFLPETVPVTSFIVQAGAYTDHSNAVRAQRALAARYSPVWIAVA